MSSIPNEPTRSSLAAMFSAPGTLGEIAALRLDHELDAMGDLGANDRVRILAIAVGVLAAWGRATIGSGAAAFVLDAAREGSLAVVGARPPSSGCDDATPWIYRDAFLHAEVGDRLVQRALDLCDALDARTLDPFSSARLFGAAIGSLALASPYGPPVVLDRAFAIAAETVEERVLFHPLSFRPAAGPLSAVPGDADARWLRRYDREDRAWRLSCSGLTLPGAVDALLPVVDGGVAVMPGAPDWIVRVMHRSLHDMKLPGAALFSLHRRRDDPRLPALSGVVCGREDSVAWAHDVSRRLRVSYDPRSADVVDTLIEPCFEGDGAPPFVAFWRDPDLEAALPIQAGPVEDFVDAIAWAVLEGC